MIRQGITDDGRWLIDSWAKGVRWGVELRETLLDEHSAFQHIQIFDTVELGRLLVLDGNLQCAERDEAGYHELIVHPGLCRAGAVTPPGGRRVLIIGGGDGGAAREALCHDDVSHVELVDIDARVIDACRELMPNVFCTPQSQHSGAPRPLNDDPRFVRNCTDGVQFLEADGEGYDHIVVDASDPVGPGTVLYSDRFYSALRKRLRDGGAVSVQAGSWRYLPEVLQTVYTGLSRHFARVAAYQCHTEIYPGGTWNLVMATTGDAPDAVDAARADGLVGRAFYDAQVHQAAFILPPAARAVLAQPPPSLERLSERMHDVMES